MMIIRCDFHPVFAVMQSLQKRRARVPALHKYLPTQTPVHTNTLITRLAIGRMMLTFGDESYWPMGDMLGGPSITVFTTMQCPNCQSQLSPYAGQCDRCGEDILAGQHLLEESGVVEPAPAPEPKAAASTRSKNSGIIALPVWAIGLLLLCSTPRCFSGCSPLWMRGLSCGGERWKEWNCSSRPRRCWSQSF